VSSITGVPYDTRSRRTSLHRRARGSPALSVLLDADS